MTAKNVNFKWYQYVDDDGRNWSMKVSTNVGDLAGLGFGAHVNTDPVFPRNFRCRPRALKWVDLNTGRTTTTPVGSATATLWVTPTTFTSYGKDTTTDIVYTYQGKIKERISTGGAIVAKPEPA